MSLKFERDNSQDLINPRALNNSIKVLKQKYAIKASINIKI